MRTPVYIICIILLLSASASLRAQGSPDRDLLGFAPGHSASERELESRFDSFLDRGDLAEWMKRLSAHQHQIGSARTKENAEFIASLFRSWGYDTKIEEFSVLFPTPKTRVLEMTAPTRYTATLAEPPLAEDATSALTAEQLPVYNAYSIDGDVTGELVYVNYGVPKDYEVLEQNGVDVKGKIVIARYGGSWRGIKPKVAAEHGAVGCLIYSDPHEDGYFNGDPYPKGAYRSEWGAQRGSVADMPLYSGDPLTPGVGATKDAKRLSLAEAKTLTRIPCLPISYGDALPLLEALAGAVAPEEWRGSLALTYHLGPGPATVHLKLEFNWDMVPAYVIIATLRGSGRPDEWIVRGNHHDAWTYGALDPLSGLVSLLEEAKGYSRLVKNGWKPKRTIVYAAWDGEEPGLLGSTEWAEAHADELATKAVAYINTDSNSRGFLGMGGSHTLQKFINQVPRDVTDPEKNISVAERLRSEQILNGSAEDRTEARERDDFSLYALGSGSDYTPFLQHVGIASLSLGYGGEGGGGEYHSIYDSYDHLLRFGDSKFDYGIALSQTVGRTVLRLANADVLPFDFSAFVDAVEKYQKEVVKLLEDTRTETGEINRMLDDRTYDRASDPRKTFVPPKRRDPVPYLNFAPLQNAVSRLKESAAEYSKAYSVKMSGGGITDESLQRSLDAVLLGSERALMREEGIPGRPWYRHMIYAPGKYAGYDVKTLPLIRESIELRKWKDAEEGVVITARTLEGFTGQIDRATAMLKGGK